MMHTILRYIIYILQYSFHSHQAITLLPAGKWCTVLLSMLNALTRIKRMITLNHSHIIYVAVW